MVCYDFTCPYCEAEFDNEGDCYGDGDQAIETCPKCEREFIATAYISVDYACESVEDAAKAEDGYRDGMKKFYSLRDKI